MLSFLTAFVPGWAGVIGRGLLSRLVFTSLILSFVCSELGDLGTGVIDGGAIGSTFCGAGVKKGLSAKPDLLILIEPPLRALYRHEHRRNWERARIYACAWNELLPSLHSWELKFQ